MLGAELCSVIVKLIVNQGLEVSERDLPHTYKDDMAVQDDPLPCANIFP